MKMNSLMVSYKIIQIVISIAVPRITIYVHIFSGIGMIGFANRNREKTDHVYVQKYLEQEPSVKLECRSM